MAADMAAVARALDQVESAGQARAALSAASGELDRGVGLVPNLNGATVPDPGQAYADLATLRGAIDGEARLYSSQADDSPVDAATWARTRREIERTYIDVSGIEGVAGAVDAIDTSGIIVDAIAGAPKVLGQAIGDVVSTAGNVVGQAGAGFLSGLGVVGVLVLVVVAVLILRGRIA
jgi:hypothetical protein